MPNINIGIFLPKDAATQKIAFLGRTGSGKTYGASKLAEEFNKINAQFVVIDPVGVWWGLRLASNGKKSGISIPVFGGLHGDIPLEPHAGKLMADIVADRGISAILDISQFEHNVDKARFAEDFAARFFFKKKSMPSAVHLFLEEAQEFLPQNPAKGEEKMLGAFERLWKLGRNFGIGGSLISQRPQEVNKKALNQTECIFAFQMTGTHERKAIENWIADKGIDEDISAILPKLEIGEPRIWSPQWLKISKTIKIPKKDTFNASSTPEVGKHPKSMKPLATIELEKIKDEMKQTIEKARAEDPKLLQKRIHELESQVKNKNIVKEIVHDKVDKRLEQEYNIRMKKLAADMKKEYEGSIKMVTESNHKLLMKLNKIAAIMEVGDIAVTDWKKVVVEERKLPSPVIPIVAKERSNTFQTPYLYMENKSRLSPAYSRLLKAAAMFSPEPITRSKMAVLAKVPVKASTFRNGLSRLKSLRFIEVEGEMITCTDEGREQAGDFDALPQSAEDSIKMWMQKLSPAYKRILQAAIDAYPQWITREVLSENSGVGMDTSTFRNGISRLKTLGLIKVYSGKIMASDELMS